MKTRSLRRRLLKMLALPLVVGMLIIGLASYYNSRHEAEEIYDAQLAHFAHVLGLLTLHEIEEGDFGDKIIPISRAEFSTPYEKDFAYRVWAQDIVILQSDNTLDFGPLTQSVGFTDRIIGDRLWRLYVRHEGILSVEVAEDYAARHDLVARVAFSILLPILLLLPLAAFVLMVGLRYGLRPLERLSAFIERQQPESLVAIEAEDTPTEAVPLIEAINRLMQRISNAIEREKRFNSYAAHELRTPLAALKIRLQVALRHKDTQKLRESLIDLAPMLDRMEHLVEQLLTLARAQKGDLALKPVNFSILCQRLAEQFESLAKARQQVLTIQLTPDVFIAGHEDLLVILLRNLLANAIAYSPPEAKIDLSLDSDALLTVSNSDIELSAEQQELLFEPFYRGKENTTVGAGLGLTIVQWIAAHHNAAIGCLSTSNLTQISLRFERIRP